MIIVRIVLVLPDDGHMTETCRKRKNKQEKKGTLVEIVA
jgi:hypothetical protein